MRGVDVHAQMLSTRRRQQLRFPCRGYLNKRTVCPAPPSKALLLAAYRGIIVFKTVGYVFHSLLKVNEFKPFIIFMFGV